MGGTKIIVLQLKDIIKTAVIAVIGLVLIVLLVVLFLPKDKDINSSSLFVPGTYFSEIGLKTGTANVAVTVTDNEIISVELSDLNETQDVFYPLLSPVMKNLAAEIIETQNAEIVPAEDSIYTESVLLSAVNTALDKARSIE